MCDGTRPRTRGGMRVLACAVHERWHAVVHGWWHAAVHGWWHAAVHRRWYAMVHERWHAWCTKFVLYVYCMCVLEN